MQTLTQIENSTKPKTITNGIQKHFGQYC